MVRWLFDLKLGVKFGILVVVVVALLTLATTYVNMRAHHAYQIDQLVQKGKTLGRFFTAVTESSALPRDVALLEHLLRELAGDGDVAHVILRGDAGDSVLAFARRGDGLVVPADADLLADAKDERRLIEQDFDITTVDGSRSVFFLALPSGPIDDEYRALTHGLLWETALVAGILCLLIYFDFIYFVLLPIKRLRRGLRTVADGRFDGQVVKSFDDEIGQVTDDFNFMLDRLRETMGHKEKMLQASHQQALEHARIVRDLHDDVGAELLTLVHRSENAGNAAIARRALSNLRETIRGLGSGRAISLLDARDLWLDEARDRLDAAGLELVAAEEVPLPEVELASRQFINVSRILRESVTNAIKHSGARTVRIEAAVRGDCLHLSVCDDGLSDTVGNWQAGTGLTNMKTRAAEINGRLNWLTGADDRGVTVALSCPLGEGEEHAVCADT